MMSTQGKMLVETLVKFGSLLMEFSYSCHQATDLQFTRAHFSINSRWRHLDLVLRRIHDDIELLKNARLGTLDPGTSDSLQAAPSLDIETFYVVVRSFMDDIAALTPCFYPKGKMRPKRKSFSDQLKWYIKHPDFDPPMTRYMEKNLGWFDKLKDVRDDLLHRQCDVLPINSGPESAQGNIPIHFAIVNEFDLNIEYPELETELRTILRNLLEFLAFYASHFRNRIPNDWPCYKNLTGHSPKGGVHGLEFLKYWTE